jgi:predicted nucleotide-binding protein
VILELGYFIGKLGRERVVAIVVGEMETPSDVGGTLYVKFDTDGAWRGKLAREMKAAGLPVDLNKLG